jgi:hypothetical protein
VEAIELSVLPADEITLEVGPPENVTLTVSLPEVIELTAGHGETGPAGPEGPPGPPSYIAVDSDLNAATSLVLLVKGMAETVVLTAALDPEPLFAELVAQATVSADDFGQTKQATFRVRRDGLAGAVLSAWQVPSFANDSKTGNVFTTHVSVYDDAPTTGTYVFTVQVTTGSANTEIWSASRRFDLLGYSGTGDPGPAGPPGEAGPAGPGVAAGGTTGQALVKASGTDYDTAWASAVAPLLHASTHGSAGTDPVTITQSQVTGLTTALAGKATDTAVVHTTGAETVGGAKTFTSPGQFPYLGVATAPSTDRLMNVFGSPPGAQASTYGIVFIPVAPATSTGSVTGMYLRLDTAAAAFTVGTAVGLSINPPNVGAGSAITNLYGILVAGMTAGATTNWGVAIGAASTQTLWLDMNASNTSPNAGIGFGVNRDTNLYRNGVGVLRTDGALAVGASPAASGALRLASGAGINWRGSGGTDTGSITYTAGDIMQVIAATAGELYAGASPTRVVKWDAASGLQVYVGAITVGTKTATSGTIRLANAASIVWRDQPDTTNAASISTTSGNAIQYAASGAHQFIIGANAPLIVGGTTLILTDAVNLQFGTTAGTKIGTAAGQPIGFFGAVPVVRPTGTPAAATDPATTMALANDLRAKLISLGLIA